MSAAPASSVVPCSSATWRALRSEWEELAAASAEVPLFLGSAWVETWLEVFGDELRPSIWTHRSGSRLEAACLLVERRERRGPIPVRCLYLNTAGEEPGEGVCLEYNQVLCREGSRDEAAAALGAHLDAEGADELVASGVGESALELLRRALPRWSAEVRWSDDPYVDLGRLRREGLEYRQAALSRNTRAQVKRSLRAYAELGPLRVDVAESPEDGLALLEELMRLHQESWRGRGLPGAFASERNRRFHRAFAARGVASGAVQLARVRAGEETIGILYSFVDRGRVFFYQSGLHYREGNRFRPGLAAHVCAIERCLALGLAEYHFLAGDETTPRYKASLASHGRSLAWAHFQRPGLKSGAIRRLRALKRRLAPA